MPRILIVDDSTTMRRMVKATLSALDGAVFEEAGSGLEAIEHLALSSCDLMILDMNMPDMHGLEVLQFLRRYPSYQGIPVIVLTTRWDEDSREAAMAAGASLYVTKPFAPGVLVDHAREFLEARHTTA